MNFKCLYSRARRLRSHPAAFLSRKIFERRTFKKKNTRALRSSFAECMTSSPSGEPPTASLSRAVNSFSTTSVIAPR